MTRVVPRWRTILWLAYALLLMTLTHLPKRDIERIPIHIWDKLAHFVAYFFLAVLTALAHPAATQWRRPARVMAWLAGLLLFAALDEWTQPWIGRDCEFDDWLADAIGLGAGIILGCIAGGATHRMQSARDTGHSTEQSLL